MKIAIKIALIWLSIFDKHRLLFKNIILLQLYTHKPSATQTYKSLATA